MSESPVFAGTFGAKTTGSAAAFGAGVAGTANEASLVGGVLLFGKTKDPG